MFLKVSEPLRQSIKDLWSEFWRFGFMIIFPILVGIPCAVHASKFSAGIFTLLIIAGFWITDVIPMHITAMFPVVLAPALGLCTSSEVCQQYTSDTVFLFIGGIIIALAIEHSQLHRRLSINVVRIVGTDKRLMLAGFMLPTWFLSMWISNTAATVMMITIVNSVLQSLERGSSDEPTSDQKTDTRLKVGESIEMKYVAPDPNSTSINLDESSDDLEAYKKDIRKFGVALCLSICYSATCGGIATLTGTAPNTVLLGIINNQFGSVEGFNYASWMAYATPISFIQLLITWFTLMLVHMGPRKMVQFGRNKSAKQIAIDQRTKNVIDREIESLGPITYEECSAAFLFLLVALLWISRDPGSAGWSVFFKELVNSGGRTEPYVRDAQSAMLVAILTMIWPGRNPWREFKRIVNRHRTMSRCLLDSQMNLSSSSSNGLNLITTSRLDNDTEEEEEKKPLFLLPWEVVMKRFPWGLMFVIGGSFALSKITHESGLSEYAGEQFRGLTHLSVGTIVFIISLITCVITDVASNVATATILVPIVIDMAERSQLHPFVLAFPMIVSTSFAFCLPVGTPPNAIAFSSGRVTIREMFFTGIILDVTGVLIVTACTMTYAFPLFNLHEFPAWANSTLVSFANTSQSATW